MHNVNTVLEQSIFGDRDAEIIIGTVSSTEYRILTWKALSLYFVPFLKNCVFSQLQAISVKIYLQEQVPIF